MTQNFEVAQRISYLSENWKRLCTNLGISAELMGAYFSMFVEQYGHGRERAYHCLKHIEFMLINLQPVRSLISNTNAVESAIWFHDVDPDEDKSVQIFLNFAKEAGFCYKLIHDVCAMIHASKHKKISIYPDIQVFCDIDLLILGQPEDVFDEYEVAVRKEYQQVEQSVFNNKRAEILDSFLRRKSIYSSAYFKEKYEDKAKENLKRSIAQLTARG